VFVCVYLKKELLFIGFDFPSLDNSRESIFIKNFINKNKDALPNI
jgi:hypothetical protein